MAISESKKYLRLGRGLLLLLLLLLARRFSGSMQPHTQTCASECAYAQSGPWKTRAVLGAWDGRDEKSMRWDGGGDEQDDRSIERSIDRSMATTQSCIYGDCRMAYYS